MLALCRSGQAQQPTDLSTIKKQIDTLEKQQRLILKKLDEMETRSVSQSGEGPAALTTTDVRGEIFKGEPGAKVAIIEYADFECPFCGQFERQTFPDIAKNYIQTGKIKYFYRDLPLHHPHAMAAARASRCAGDQGRYWDMHDALFGSQANLADAHLSELAASLGMDTTKFVGCLASDRFTSEVQASADQANKLGIRGTPAFVIGTFEGGGNTLRIDKRIIGAVPYEVLKTDLDGLLAGASPRKAGVVGP